MEAPVSSLSFVLFKGNNNPAPKPSWFCCWVHFCWLCAFTRCTGQVPTLTIQLSVTEGAMLSLMYTSKAEKKVTNPYAIPGLLRDQFLDVGVGISQVIYHDGAVDQPSIDVVCIIQAPAAAPHGAASIVCLHHGVCCQAAGEKQTVGPLHNTDWQDSSATTGSTSGFFLRT